MTNCKSPKMKQDRVFLIPILHMINTVEITF